MADLRGASLVNLSQLHKVDLNVFHIAMKILEDYPRGSAAASRYEDIVTVVTVLFFSLKARELVRLNSAFFGSPSLLESGGASDISRETSETRRLRVTRVGFVRLRSHVTLRACVLCVCVCDQNVAKKEKKKSQFRGQCLCVRARARARLLVRFQRPVLTSFSSSPPFPFIG